MLLTNSYRGSILLINVPSTDNLDEMALRFYFDAWERIIRLLSDFTENYQIDVAEVESEHIHKEEWDEYIEQAQSEMGAIFALIQQSAELRLKAIICKTSPFLLLNGLSYKTSEQCDIDFTEQRTLDAVDLPSAVRTLTDFELPDKYLGQYASMRRLRNQYMHLGSHKGSLTHHQIVKILSEQYLSLWPGGRWLYRRVRFDGNSARRYFHDERYSSVQSNVMLELPCIIGVMDNAVFKKAIGCSKSKLNGYCPICMSALASKWDTDGHATAYRTGSDTAKCAMCETELTLKTSKQECFCEGKLFVGHDPELYDPICFSCGLGLDEE